MQRRLTMVASLRARSVVAIHWWPRTAVGKADPRRQRTRAGRRAISNGTSRSLLQQPARLAQITCIETLVERRVKPRKAFSGFRGLAALSGLEPDKAHERAQSQRSAA